MLLSFLLYVNVKQNAHQPHGEQNAADAERVSHGVAHAHMIHDAWLDTQIAQDLLPGSQRGGVGDRTGENPQHHWQRDGEEFMQQGGD